MARTIVLACLLTTSCARALPGLTASVSQGRPPIGASRARRRFAALRPGRLDPSDVRRGLFLVAASAATGVVMQWSAHPSWPFMLWTAAIAAVTVPWRDFHRTPGRYVAWIPFVSPPVGLWDIVANVLMYVPFGALYARWRPGDTVLEGALPRGLMLSVAAEFSQLFSRGRVTSATDVATNVIGAALGAWAWRVIRGAVPRRGVRPA